MQRDTTRLAIPPNFANSATRRRLGDKPPPGKEVRDTGAKSHSPHCFQIRARRKRLPRLSDGSPLSEAAQNTRHFRGPRSLLPTPAPPNPPQLEIRHPPLARISAPLRRQQRRSRQSAGVRASWDGGRGNCVKVLAHNRARSVCSESSHKTLPQFSTKSRLGLVCTFGEAHRNSHDLILGGPGYYTNFPSKRRQKGPRLRRYRTGSARLVVAIFFLLYRFYRRL